MMGLIDTGWSADLVGNLIRSGTAVEVVRLNRLATLSMNTGDEMKHYIHFGKSAITQILLNGFEAFVINHANRKRNGLEMHASLYGYYEETSRTRHHHVEFISVDTSAEMTGGYVMPDPDAQALKTHLALAMDYQALGALHTHPYLLAEEKASLDFVRQEGCDFSRGDLDCFTAKLQELHAAGQESAEILEVVLTIKQMERLNNSKDGYLDGQENVFEFAVGNCKCFLRAQVFSLDEQGALQAEPSVLKCDYLQGFHHVATDFGRVRVVPGKQRIVEHKV